MNLKKCINQIVVKIKPTELYEGFVTFSFMDNPIEIVDIGQKFIFYKEVSFFKYLKQPLLEEIKTLPIVYNDNSWVIYDHNKKEEYVLNRISKHEKYEKNNPELVAAMRRAY